VSHDVTPATSEERGVTLDLRHAEAPPPNAALRYPTREYQHRPRVAPTRSPRRPRWPEPAQARRRQSIQPWRRLALPSW